MMHNNPNFCHYRYAYENIDIVLIHSQYIEQKRNSDVRSVIDHVQRDSD